MNYEQRYKEALARARVVNPGTEDYNIVTAIFPELKESEDERIRKEIIHYLDREITLSNFGGDIATFKRWIAWLEKQGEQNINDKTDWSEEDEDSVDIAIRIIQNEGDDCAGILDSDKALKWLQSLKQRLNGYR
jgi:hypothetical protein